MKHDFKVGDMVRHVRCRWGVGKVVNLHGDMLIVENNNNEMLTVDIAHNYELIDYKNEYHRLTEENELLRTQLIDARASKETIHSFYRDNFYLKNKVIAFLSVAVAVETIFLIVRCLL